jgi:hypothetical protein
MTRHVEIPFRVFVFFLRMLKKCGIYRNFLNQTFAQTIMIASLPLPHLHSAGIVAAALAQYRQRLIHSMQRTNEYLRAFEEWYNISTQRFLAEYAAEDLEGGDREYVEWAGEAAILEKLTAELELTDALLTNF